MKRKELPELDASGVSVSHLSRKQLAHFHQDSEEMMRVMDALEDQHRGAWRAEPAMERLQRRCRLMWKYHLEQNRAIDDPEVLNLWEEWHIELKESMKLQVYKYAYEIHFGRFIRQYNVRMKLLRHCKLRDLHKKKEIVNPAYYVPWSSVKSKYLYRAACTCELVVEQEKLRKKYSQ
jgi:hypothetical protein